MKKFTVLFLLLISFSVSGQRRTGQGAMPPIEREQFFEANAPSIGLSVLKHPTAQPGNAPVGLFKSNQGFGWITSGQGTGIPEGPVSIDLANGALSSINAVDPQTLWMIGGDFAHATWYTVSYSDVSSGLYTVGKETGSFTLIGQTGHSMTGLAFDPLENTMYASGVSDGFSFLYTIDLTSGSATLIGQICDGLIVGIAADLYGNIYGINLADNNLYQIDSQTGAGIIAGNLGVNINFAQDIGFDRDQNLLYGTLYYQNTPHSGTGGLFLISTSTGHATHITGFIAEVAAFGIPYTVVDDNAPAPVSDLIVSAADLGVLQASVSWINPSSTPGGQPLTQLTEIIVERNGQPLQTIGNPQIGEPYAFEDDAIESPGWYNYLVYAVNSAGNSMKRPFSIWVGEDLPGAPLDVVVTAVGNDGQIGWQAPAEGLNGGYFSGDNVSYKVVRFPGEVVVADNLIATDFVDTSIPGIGNYYYTITASNTSGQGGTAVSAYQLLAAGDALFFEDFNYPVGQMPVGWTLDGFQHQSWMVTNASFAGGTAPELWLHYNPPFIGLSRIVSPPITIQNNRDVRLVFKQLLNNYGGDQGEIIGVDFTADNGNTWHMLWEKVIGTNNIVADEYEFFFTVPHGVEQIHIAFRFQGNTYMINQWVIDDILLSPVQSNDLKAVAVSGSLITPQGEENLFTIEVLNAGSGTQFDYTVKLVKEGGEVIASMAGTSLAFAQKAFFTLPWIPEEEELGSTFVYGVVDFALDENPDNNTTPDFKVIVMPEGTLPIEIGTDSNTLNFLPYSFGSNYSLTQTLYYPGELVLSMGNITGILYTNEFNETVNDVPVMIWLGETTEADLSESWADPGSFDLVFQGLVDFPAGINKIYIPFDNPYFYNGDNLLVHSYKSYGDASYLKNFFASIDPSRSRSRVSESMDMLNPMQIPEFGFYTTSFPNVQMLFSTEGMGGLQGTVSSTGGPVQGVEVQVLGTNARAITLADGSFSIPWLMAGSYNLRFSKLGYYDFVLENVIIQVGMSSQVEATIEAIPTVSVSGKITGSDMPTVGLSGAKINLRGYQNYSVETDQQGDFVINGVYIESSYDINILVLGYNRYTASVEVGTSDVDLQTIVLMEVALAVGDVYAEETDQGAMVWWEQPGEDLLMLSYYDDSSGEYASYYQSDEKVYGTVFDLVEYPDAKLSFIDFHHLSWGMPADHYPYLVHIVDWETFEILTTAGPFHTKVIDDWELQVGLGDFSVAGYEKVGVLIQPQGNNPWDAYPCVSVDTHGPNGLSVTAYLNDLPNCQVNDQYMGDFLINLWIKTSYSKEGLLKVANTNIFTEKPGSASGSPENKAFAHYRVYRLMEGQEDVMGSWVQVSNHVTDTLYLDTQWLTLTQGHWRYAVIAEYTNENLSVPKFSNSLFKPLFISPVAKQNVKVFPIPAQDWLSVWSDDLILEVNLVDIAGKQVYRREAGNTQLNIPTGDIAPGFYFLRVYTLNGLTVVKVQIAR
ncbi:MAG: carboxypeptidase regulatory-like domain-containing protein [Bacteroidales bacterium]